MRKIRLMRMVLVCAFIAVAALSPVFGQDRSVFWESWEVNITDVDTAANSFRVTEYYDITFTGSFSFGSLEIPYRNLENISNLEIRQDGTPLRAGCNGGRGTFCAARDNDNLSVTYYFLQPITNARLNFDITYIVNGALRVYPEGDQLWWDAIPAEHFGFSIANASVTVRMPPGFAPREGIDPVEVYGVPGEVTVRGTTVTARALNTLEGNDSFSIRVQYPHNPQARIAGWQSTFDQQRGFDENVRPLLNVGLIALSLLIAIGLPLYIWTRYLNAGRDPQTGPVPTFLTEPPSALPPAVVGTLVDERADVRDVMSTLLDLGGRGYLVIEEAQEEGLFGIGKTSKYTFKRTDKPIDGDELRPFEQRLLSNMFAGNVMERSLESMQTVFHTVISLMQQDLYEEVVTQGMFARNPNATRSAWMIGGVGLFMLALFIGFVMVGVIESTTPVLLGIPIALGIGAFTTLLFAPGMPSKTQKGAEEAAKWKAFVEYLRNLDRYGDVESAAANFDTYLPYAVTAGIDRGWVKRFKSVPQVPIPAWYYPTYLSPYRRGYIPGSMMRNGGIGMGQGGGLPGELARAGDGGLSLDNLSGDLGGSLDNISSGLTNMIDSAGRIMTSQPAQSGGSGRWSSGGRGWSGGGSRGFGGSGGGSRGFG